MPQIDPHDPNPSIFPPPTTDPPQRDMKPLPGASRNYQVFIQSPAGPIDVFLVSRPTRSPVTGHIIDNDSNIQPIYGDGYKVEALNDENAGGASDGHMLHKTDTVKLEPHTSSQTDALDLTSTHGLASSSQLTSSQIHNDDYRSSESVDAIGVISGSDSGSGSASETKPRRGRPPKTLKVPIVKLVEGLSQGEMSTTDIEPQSSDNERGKSTRGRGRGRGGRGGA